MRLTLFLFLISISSNYAQQTKVQGYIYDKTSNTPLPYATVKLSNQDTNYTITNEDGLFEITGDFISDLVEVRFLGFETTTVSLSYFKNKSILYLSPNIYQIDNVFITSNKDKYYAHKLLYKLIEKYKKNHIKTESKAFLSLTSSARNTPIEQLEAFYSSTQTPAKGIENMTIKSGRFGQNKSFSFYSLSNNHILMNFHLFGKYPQILPQYPGNLSLSAIKSKYNIKIETCNNCLKNDVLISFVPKRFNGKLFFGKILFDKNKLLIKKIDLGVNNPSIKGLSPLTDDAIFTPKEILLNVTYNPLDLEKIQFIDFTFKMDYQTADFNELIDTRSFLYFYDYKNPFKKPYFTNNIIFHNNYDEIIALKTSKEFWTTNYQFPNSYDKKRSLKFLRKFGYIINYDSQIPKDYIKFIKPSVILWNKNERLGWDEFKTLSDNLNNNESGYKAERINEVNNVVYSSLDLKKASENKKIKNQFLFSYVLNQNKNRADEIFFNTHTLFVRNSSIYEGARTPEELIYLNLCFDIYEYYRQKLENRLVSIDKFEDAKKIADTLFNEAGNTVKHMEKETLSGSNNQELLKWNNKIKGKLGIDNIKLIKR